MCSCLGGGILRPASCRLLVSARNLSDWVSDQVSIELLLMEVGLDLRHRVTEIDM